MDCAVASRPSQLVYFSCLCELHRKRQYHPCQLLGSRDILAIKYNTIKSRGIALRTAFVGVVEEDISTWRLVHVPRARSSSRQTAGNELRLCFVSFDRSLYRFHFLKRVYCSILRNRWCCLVCWFATKPLTRQNLWLFVLSLGITRLMLCLMLLQLTSNGTLYSTSRNNSTGR